MKYIGLILLFCFIPYSMGDRSTMEVLDSHNQKIAYQILDLIQMIIKDTNERIGHLSVIRQNAQGRPAFEVGYIMFNLQEKYRRMVTKYHTAHFMRRKFFPINFVFYLEEVELHYWEIEHIGNMLHEIERKYLVKGGLDKDYEVPPTVETTTAAVHTRPTVKWFTRSKSVQTLCMHLSDIQSKILNEVSWPLKMKLLKGYEQTNTQASKQSAYRRVGIQAYRMGKNLRDDDEEVVVTTPKEKHDENSMKMKLFRLMYETVRDSDVKVKRAEVIKKYYANSTSFNLGYVMGEITERFNVMKDVSMTMKKLYVEWKPMEHINAYEQIANKAVELCNMVDMARSMLKSDSNYTFRVRNRH